ncbi:hypothetical protein DL96DRAFT_1628612 [Flagelloscypha sp. PMI_526]|nr:hypothetical protein DL96DRAFT_1628612 [Flagelloscypha sp. PMI_526]
MALGDLAEDLVSDIVSFVASDILSLKNLALVNHRLNLSASMKLFARFWVCIGSSEFGRQDVVKGHGPSEFVAFAQATPKVVSLIRRVHLSRTCLVHHDEGFPAALEKLVGIQHLEFYGSLWFALDWMAVPQSMRNSLLLVVFPRLQNLCISTSIYHFPSYLLNYAPLLSSLDLQGSLDPTLDPVIDASATVGMWYPLRQLKLGVQYSTAISTAQGLVFKLIEGRISEPLDLTLDYKGPPVRRSFHHRLGLCVRHLTIMPRSDVVSLSVCFPFLETLSMVIVAAGYGITVTPILWLTQSLLEGKHLTLAKINFVFKSFPFCFDAPPKTKVGWTECERQLEAACPQLTSIHATFDVDPTYAVGRRFNLDNVKQELEELLPLCFEKGIVSVEDVTREVSPWVSESAS